MDHAPAAEAFARGLRLLSARQVPDAVSCFSYAESLGFDANECAAALWNCWMLSGRFEQAWAESDRILSNQSHDPYRFWDGQPWSGKRVMLRCLHGLGDTIQFIRYAPLIAQTSKSLVAQVHPQLVTLIRGVAGIDHVITWSDSAQPEPAWDMQMEVNELPRAFRSTLRDLPRKVPYIHVPRERVAWASNLLDNPRGLKIGVSWESGPWNPDRSIALEQLTPLLSSDTNEFYSLQKAFDARQVDNRWPLRNLEVNALDVRDTAALILNLDLVITVDTITAHLAGALGRPVWILLPFEADWRWMLDRSDTPWYPTARLFRQTSPGDWSTVLEAILREFGNIRVPEALRSAIPTSP
jgi:hypothetical protein